MAKKRSRSSTPVSTELPPVNFTEDGECRYLHLGTEWIQGAMRLDDPLVLELEYIQRMMAWLLFMDPDSVPERHAMQLGLGAASLTRFTHLRMQLLTSCIELNPIVYSACRQWFRLPDNNETIKATEILAKEGFIVLPYMYPDLYAARALADAGAAAIMPLASPIGTNKGLSTKDFIQILIDEVDLPVIVDAGIGRPSQACEAMEMGAAAIMANTAVATAGDLPLMAKAFGEAIRAGRNAYLAGLGRVRETASASDPLTGFLGD